VEPLPLLVRGRDQVCTQPEEANRLRWIYRFEPLIAVILLLTLAPLILALIIAIWVMSRRAPLIAHTRVGWRGKQFRMLKLRTMWTPRSAWCLPFGIEDVSSAVPLSKSVPDTRVANRFAAICRRYSLDELPQLIHVTRGQMSLVGPRPITRAELDTHYGRSSHLVLLLRPGLTGLWQVMGRNKLTYSQRRRLDVLFVRRASPALYFRVLVRSVPKVIRGEGSY
jgi:exopolysaccharide production protein ExoY